MRQRIKIVLYLMFLNSMIIAQGFSNTIISPISLRIANNLIINQISGNLNFEDVFENGNIQTISRTPDLGVLFEVNGFPRAEISVNYSNNISLDNNDWVNSFGGINGNLIFTPNVRHTGKRSTYVSSKKLRSGRIIKIRNDNGIGRLFIWVGGDIEVIPNQAKGSYKGTFSITVAYN